MQCLQCGSQFADGMPNCPNCGMPAINQYAGTQGQPYMQGQPYGTNRPLTRKEFAKHPNMQRTTGNINYAAIMLYICAGISFIFGIVSGSFSIVLDVMIVVGLALGIHLSQSRACAILILIYSFINMVSMQINTGHKGGTLIMIAAFYAVFATFRFKKAWKTYQKTGVVPIGK